MVRFLASKKSTEPEVIGQKLDRIAKLLALDLVRNQKSSREQVKSLHLAGFGPREIAELLKISAVTVRVTLFNIRQAERRKKARQARRARK